MTIQMLPSLVINYLTFILLRISSNSVKSHLSVFLGADLEQFDVEDDESGEDE